MAPQFKFDGYTVRPLTEQDRAYLDLLIDADEYHRGRMDADFFLKRQQGEDAWALEDQHGQIVFYFKTTTAVRLAIQFRPSSSPADRLRNAAAMMRGLRWIEGVLRSNGFREMVTDTEGPELRNFLKKNGWVLQRPPCFTGKSMEILEVAGSVMARVRGDTSAGSGVHLLRRTRNNSWTITSNPTATAISGTCMDMIPRTSCRHAASATIFSAQFGFQKSRQ